MSRNLPRQNRQGRLVAETIVRYRTADVGGLKIFYREAGRSDAPALLLLHSFPTASHMFRDLIPLLADRPMLWHGASVRVWRVMSWDGTQARGARCRRAFMLPIIVEKNVGGEPSSRSYHFSAAA